MVHDSSRSLPVGFEFRPTEVELLKYHLDGKNYATLHQFDEIVIKEFQVVYKFDPWVLADKSSFQSRDRVWYFYSRRSQRNPGESSSHSRPSSVGEEYVRTPYGVWLPTGEEGYVRETPWSLPIGKKRTLVFFRFSDNGNIRTNWTIHEYTTITDQGRYVLCSLVENPEGFLPSNMTSNSRTVPVGGEPHGWHNAMASGSADHVPIEAEADNRHNSAGSSCSDPVTDKAEVKGVESDDETFQWPDSVIDFIDNDDYLYNPIPLEVFLYHASPDGTILSMGESLQNANVEQNGGIHLNDSFINIPISSSELEQLQNGLHSDTNSQGASNNVDNDAHEEP